MDRLKWDKAYALEQAGDDSQLVEELLEIFKDSLRTDLLRMAKGLGEGSASLGIAAFSELAMEIEQQGYAGNLDLAREKFPLLKDLHAELQNL